MSYRDFLSIFGGCSACREYCLLPTKRKLIGLLLLAGCLYGQAQMVVTQNANTQSLAQLLAGPGVTISNYTKNCDNNGTGTFTNNNTNLGLNQGVVLASGKVQNIAQAANNFASTQFSNSNDAELSSLTSGNIYDKCIIEFDIVPQGSDLRFNYVFASEEYPEFVCSPYNDVFGFFISGPNPAGGNYSNQNIATVPNSTTPVFINSVNPGISGTYNGTTWNSNNCQSLNNTAYYINNLSPVNPNIVYDGMTVVLQAAANVVPCQVYHLKLAVADVGDRIYDSGVFLEAYSFTSAAVSVSASAQLDYAGFTSAYEGCVGGTFTVSISAPQSVNDTVPLQVTGSALNGVDYNSIPAFVVIPAGQTSVTIPLTPLQDNLAEPQEDVTVAVLNPCTGAVVSSATLTIEDHIPIDLTVSDSTICAGQSAQLFATGGLSYAWTPATTLSNATVSNPVATPVATTDYAVQITFGGCSETLSQTVYVSDPTVSASAFPNGLICSGGTSTISSTAANGVAPYSYWWSNTATSPDITVSSGGNYQLTMTDAYGCSATTAAAVSISNLQVQIAAANVSCYNGANGSATAIPSGGTSPYIYQWSNGATGASSTNLAPGVYTVTVTDSSSCSVATSVTVSQPSAALTATAVAVPVSCYGSNNGAVNLTVSGGTAPYSFQWNTGSADTALANVNAGSYSVTITDAHACSITSNALVAQPSSPLSATATVDPVLCYGQSTGEVNLSVNGGVAPYNFQWSDGAVDQHRTDLAAGTYSVTIFDANHCTAQIAVTITQPAQPFSVSTSVNDVSCYGAATGEVHLSISQGTAPYLFHWSNSAATPQLTNVPSGNYAVTVTDAHGCVTQAAAVVQQPGLPLQLNALVDDVKCYGASDGSVQVTATGGTPPYTYHWNEGSTAPGLYHLTSGNYAVTVDDALNCSAALSAGIAEPPPLIPQITATDVHCYGENNGSVALSVTGGMAPYTFAWNDGTTTPAKTNTAAGSYTVTVTDAHNCSLSAAAIVQAPAPLQGSVIATDVSCFGTGNGSATLTATGGTSPYLFTWNADTVSPNMSPLNPAAYAITIHDVQGCTTQVAFTINQPQPLVLATTATHVNCFGDHSGAVQLTATGGVPTYHFVWNTGSHLQSLSQLSGGNYVVTATDANGCTASVAQAVQEPAAALSAITTIHQVSCFQGIDGSIQLQVSGGSAPYTYLWSEGSTGQHLFGIPAGAYAVTITDAHQCTATAAAVIVEPSAALQVNAYSTNANCNGASDGTVHLTVTGGTPAYSYQWNNGWNQPAITNATAGNYVVTVSDVNGCSAVIATAVSEPSPLVIHDFHGNVSCYGGDDGFIYTTVTGGILSYQYHWSNGATTADVMHLTQGTYSLTVTDAHACSAIWTTPITQPAYPLNVYTAKTDIVCNGASTGAIQLTPAGGLSPYTYAWDNGLASQQVSSLVAGTYVVTVTDANYCTASASVTLNQPQGMMLSVNHTNVSCSGRQDGSININATGGFNPYHYYWSNSGTTQNGQQLAAGQYSITVEDGHHCTAMAMVNITQPAPIEVNTVVSNTLCYGESTGGIDISVSGGSPSYSYSWSDGSTSKDLHQIPSDNYTLTVTDAHACTAVVSATVHEAAPVFIQESHTAPLCYGSANGSINITPVGGTGTYQYAWSNGSVSEDLYAITAGTYTVTVTDANSCTAQKTIAVAAPAPIMVAETHNLPACNGLHDGTIALQVTGGTGAYQYHWSTGADSATLTGITMGVYAVTVTDANHCTGSLNAIVLVQPDTVALELQVTDVACAGSATGAIQTLTMGGSSPYTYHWNNGATVADLAHAAPGSYALTVTDANGCSVTSSATIQEIPAMAVTTLPDSLPCAAAKGRIDLTVIDGTAPYTFMWSNGTTAEDLLGARPGEYAVTITDANGCTLETSITIENLHTFQVHASGGGVVDLGETVPLHAVSNGSLLTGYEWITGAGVNCPLCANTIAQPTGFTVYTVIATDTNGCTAQDTVMADVVENYSAFTPNAFTPNGDGNNDYFEFFGNKTGLKYFSIMVFDRWGEKLFESDDPYFRWDGVYKGELVQPGVYVYILKLVFINGHADKIHKGSITVIR